MGSMPALQERHSLAVRMTPENPSPRDAAATEELVSDRAGCQDRSGLGESAGSRIPGFSGKRLTLSL
jgi:hypothetical protein